MTLTCSVPSVMGLLRAVRLVPVPAVSLTEEAAWLLSQPFSEGVLENVTFLNSLLLLLA